MDILNTLHLKKEHTNRLSNTNGASGEQFALNINKHWLKRPTGKELKNLLAELTNSNIRIKRSSFDAIEVPKGVLIDFSCLTSIKNHLNNMTFIEIKTTNKESVKDDFTGYFFAFTESELNAADQLKERHKVALVNKRTGNIIMSSVPELLNRAKSMNWQVSIQL